MVAYLSRLLEPTFDKNIPKLLGLHAACARVAHMSGAAEALDEVERDVENTKVLALDGSSAHLLDYLLTPFEAIPGVA